MQLSVRSLISLVVVLTLCALVTIIAVRVKDIEQLVRTYSNPRMAATIENWPSGQHRVTAQFSIEVDHKKGERGVRVTTGAAKKLTYARKARIVDGNDGRTYVAKLTSYGHISIMRGDFKYNEETIFENDARYPAIRALFDERSEPASDENAIA